MKENILKNGGLRWPVNNQDNQQTFVSPLTKCKKTGELYQRSSKVESQIAQALSLDPECLLQRAWILEHTDLEYLQPESIVYLIRDYHARGDEYRYVVESLAKRLIKTSGKRIRKQVNILNISSTIEDAEYIPPLALADQAFNDVIGVIFERILDLDGEKADFMQVRYWIVLHTVCIDIIRQYLGWKNQKSHDKEDSNLGNEHLALEPSELEEMAISLELSPEDELVIRDGLKHITPRYRDAFYLRHFEGWQIESIDSSEPTLSQLFGKTPRTIRNWLERAEQQLSLWRKEQYEF